MNTDDRSELDELRHVQQSLKSDLEQLRWRMDELASRIQAIEQTAAEAVSMQPMELPVADVTAQTEFVPSTASPFEQAAPAAIPPVIEPVMEATTKAELQERAATLVSKLAQPAFPPAAPQSAELPAGAPLEDYFPEGAPTEFQTASAINDLPSDEPERSFEMRLGTYWLPRIGIVILLTGLAWLGYYAYDTVVVKLGPAGKLGLMYFASALLLGIGGWLQRKSEKEAVKNYGQVLFAGGLGAVYFTTYVAHYSDALRVITTPLLDGILLMAWAGFIVWIADRKKSELMAFFALGLAYYTSAITSIGSFTLFSNLVLTVATVFFVVRNQWTNLSVASLVAAYASFAFWRFHQGGVWTWSGRTSAEIWTGNAFLAGYWAAFTAIAFLSKTPSLARGARAMFATLNNGAFFALVVLSLFPAQRADFWKFALGYGAVLLVLSAVARQFLSEERGMKGAYLTQGLLLVTAGVVAKFSGQTLAAILAAETVILLVLGEQQGNVIMRAGSWITAAMAVGWGIKGMTPFDSGGLVLGIVLGALLVFNAWWCRRDDTEEDSTTPQIEAGYFSALAVTIWLAAIWQNTTSFSRAPVLAVAGLALTVSYNAIKVRELTVLAQTFLLLSHVLVLAKLALPGTPTEWTNPVIVVIATVAASHWWQFQKHFVRERIQLLAAAYAAATVGVMYFWLRPQFDPPAWLAMTSFMACAITAYGLLTRAWWLAGCAQIFLFVSGWEFATQLLRGHPEAHLALAPIAAALGLGIVATVFARRLARDDSGLDLPLAQLSTGYRWAALAMALGWIFEYVPERFQVPVITLLGVALFLVVGWRIARENFVTSAVCFIAAAVTFVLLPVRKIESVTVLNLASIIVFAGLQQLATRMPKRFLVPREADVLFTVPAGLLLWLFVTRWIDPMASGTYVALSWATLATVLFIAGRLLTERSYVILALVVLAASLGHVVVLDVWKRTVFWPNLLPIALLLAWQQLARRDREEDTLPLAVQNAMILAAGLSLWLFVSRWVVLSSGQQFLLTASWAAVALMIFVAGFALRERVYRWIGLGIMAVAIGRVFMLDVWRLPTIYRVLSFTALGVALLLLGFIYNKYQERIKAWL